MPVFPSVKGIFLDIGWTLNYPASGQWMIPLKALECMDSNVFNAIPKPRVDDAFSQGMDYLNKNHFSCYLGVYKPHPQMYKHALGAMGIPAEHTLFVDDSVANLEGAAKHGIFPVLITRKKNAEGCASFTNISKLSELLTYL